MTFTFLVALGLVACVQGDQTAGLGGITPATFTYVNPSLSPSQQNSTNYVGMSNGTIVNSPLVPGKVFDRNIIIMLENKDYAAAAASATFQKLAKKGIRFSDYYGVTHPSMPNYIASVSGSTQGSVFDDTAALTFPNAAADVKTVVDLLEAKNISWAAYLENMPTTGYTGLDYTSHNYNDPNGSDYNYYARRHSGLMKFDSITENPARLHRHRNFNNFAEDLVADALPQWVWITPNILNDGHDSTLEYAADWLEYFLVPLLDDPRFNSDRTFITLTWDECEVGTDDVNQIYVLGLGKAVPESLHGTVDGQYYNHYSQLATVEDNWDLGNLGQGDKNANVYEFMAVALEHDNTNAQPAVPGVGPNLTPAPSTPADGVPGPV
ncbi:hypothetical protein RQP46_009941 [Phenoliferia psychrophenolica]